MKKICLALGLLLPLVFIQCDSPAANGSGSSDSTSANEEALASAICKCAQPLIELNKRMEAVHEEGKKDEFIAMSSQLGKQFKETLNCAKEANGNKPIEASQKTAVANSLLQLCPDLRERLADQLANQLSNQ